MQQANDPMGRTQNDNRFAAALTGDQNAEARYGGLLDTSRARNDAAMGGAAGWRPSRSDYLSGAGGGSMPLTGQASRGGIPGMSRQTGGSINLNGQGPSGWDPNVQPWDPSKFKPDFSSGRGGRGADAGPPTNIQLAGQGASGWDSNVPAWDPNSFKPDYSSRRPSAAANDGGFPLDGKGPSGWDPNVQPWDPNKFTPDYSSGRGGSGAGAGSPRGITAAGGTGAWERSMQDGGGAPAGGNGPTPGGMTRGWNPNNVQGLSFDTLSKMTPTAADGFDTGALDNFDSENLRGVDVNGTLDRYTGGANRFQQAMRGGRTFDPVAQGGNLAAWNDGGLGGYDAGAAVKEYAGGAWNGIQMDLKNLLGEQEAASQRGGRLNSGFFDRDKGRVITDATNRFSNAVAGQAVNAAGITADARKASAQMRLSRASDADRNILDAGLQGQDLTARDLWQTDSNTRDILGLGLDAGKAATGALLDRASGMDANRLAAIKAGRDLGLDAAKYRDDYRYRGASDAANLNLDRAKSLDEMGLDRNKFVDSWDQENAQFGDTMDWNRTKDAADRTDAREARDTATWLTLGDRYRDQLVGADDRQTARRNAKAQAKQNRFQNWISGISTGVDVLNALNPMKIGIGGK